MAGGSEPQGDEKQAGLSLDEADAKLAEATEWERRSKYPFEAFLPIFHLARSRGLALIALGVDRRAGKKEACTGACIPGLAF